VRGQPAGGDKEDTELPGIAVAPPANFLCHTGRPFHELTIIPILQQAITHRKGKTGQFSIFNSLTAVKWS
jgi:hypothetical protein